MLLCSLIETASSDTLLILLQSPSTIFNKEKQVKLFFLHGLKKFEPLFLFICSQKFDKYVM